MHSIFVHLLDVSRDEISDYFDAHAERGLRDHWYSPKRSDPVFTIRFPHGNSEFRDAENRNHVAAALGRAPDLTVQFDAGAKHPGHKELRAFLVALFGEFTGVALDDLSQHVWTVDELKADTHVGGFAFADHESWRKQHKVQAPNARHG
ncbi:MAG: hypothetical protein IPJ77_08955 [Planctomycetes bacterium]|nr:hypothetical protein [Planctomycetota bacterium]